MALVIDEDLVFRGLVASLLQDICDVLGAWEPTRAAVLCQRHSPAVLVTRSDAAVQLRDLLTGLSFAASDAALPALIVVADDGPVCIDYPGVAAAVHQSRFVDDLPETVIRVLQERR